MTKVTEADFPTSTQEQSPPMKPPQPPRAPSDYDFEAGQRRYEWAMIEFLCNWLYPFCPAIPDYPPPGYPGRPHFPWDDFCRLNPGLRQTAANFAQVNNYELSEGQCSWACMKYRSQVRSWWC